MTSKDKGQVLIALRNAAEATRALVSVQPFSEKHMRWLAGTIRLLADTFGDNSMFTGTMRAFTWQRTGSVIVRGWDVDAAMRHYNQEAYIEQLGSARGLLLSAYDALNDSSLDEVKRGSQGTEAKQLLHVLALVDHRLRKGIHEAPANEKAFQRSFETLLVGADLPYSREAERVEYSSKTYTPDFTMGALDLAIELKLCNRADREKELIAEINDDVPAYRTRWKNLLFVIYDLGHIRDVDKFSEPFDSEGVIVRVVKH